MIILDFPKARRRVFREAAKVLKATRVEDVRAVIREAEAAAARGLYAVGYVSYEAAPAFDPAMRVREGARLPLAWFGLYEVAEETQVVRAGDVAVDWALPDRARFMRAVTRIREEIAAGNTYQVNLTARLVSEFDGDSLLLYEALRRAQGDGYHAYIDTGEYTIVSASPELFFELRDRRIKTRPMKGTRARGRFPAEDDEAMRALAASEKDRAENLMIVDLLRNDLGRIAETGSVEVSSLFEIERYRTIYQMTSTIEAQLGANVSTDDVFCALFPCGSVTGAPKISTMRLIAELEDSAREVYCGAVGIIEPGGNAVFNVPIRTVWLENGVARAVYGTGAGITYDSVPAAEYEEVVAKSAVLTEEWPDFELIETLRMQNGELVRIERHIERVLTSARYFGIPANEDTIRTVLADTIQPGLGRVRLLVNQDGAARAQLLAYGDAYPSRIALADSPVSSTDRFLFHKTTNRRVYDERLNGNWDVLLWNERGELTEFTRGNVVLELDGELLTPTRTSGLLAGVYRAELLENGIIREAVLVVDDLDRAARVWLINSLREWVSVDVFSYR